MATRRIFLKNAALTTAGIAVGSTISGVMAGCAPSDRINVGLIGCNGMGFTDLSEFLKHPEVECIALCDIDESVLNKRAADVEKIRGKKPANLYKDWRKLIDNKDINLVIVGTPDHWHCLQMVSACEAGKDVYCEKPMGRTIEECNLMVKAAKEIQKSCTGWAMAEERSSLARCSRFYTLRKAGQNKTGKSLLIPGMEYFNTCSSR